MSRKVINIVIGTNESPIELGQFNNVEGTSYSGQQYIISLTSEEAQILNNNQIIKLSFRAGNGFDGYVDFDITLQKLGEMNNFISFKGEAIMTILGSSQGNIPAAAVYSNNTLSIVM